MKIFAKYLIKSMTEKKGRTLLLLISIAISAALLVASMGSIKVLLGSLTTQLKGNFGTFNIQLSPTKNVEVPLFTAVNTNDTDITKSFKSIDIGGYLSNTTEKEFSLIGTTLSDFNNFGTMQILEKDNLEPFTGKKLIISKKTSDSLKAKLGDEIKLNILGKEDIYKVAAIVANKGLFFQDKEKQFTMVTPEENVAAVYNVQNKYSTQLLSVDSKDLNNWIKSFNENNKANKILASKIFDEDALNQQLSMVQMPLYFMLAIVLIMTSFIIYSSFRLIITERLSTIGVFLSQGATKGTVIVILLVESLAYGIIGGLLGDLMGAGLTNLISDYGNPLKEYGIKAVTEYYPPYFVIGLIFAIILSLLSTILPILSIRKLPVKEVILNTIGTSNKISNKSFIIGLVLVLTSIVLHFIEPKINYIGSLPSIFFALIGVLMIIPKVVDIVFKPVVRFLRNINGVSMLSFNNVRTSKVLINNIRLITLSVISIVMITALSASIVDVVKGAYDGMNFNDRIMVNSNYGSKVQDIITGYENVKDINELGGLSVTLNGDTTKTIYLDFVNPEKYKTFENYTVFKDKIAELDALNANEDGIILSHQVAVRYKIKAGDTITLTNDGINENLKVLSIFDAKLMDSGNYNLVSWKGALKHFDVKYPNQYYITTKIPEGDAKKALETKLKGLGATVITKTEMSTENAKQNKQMTDILSLFSYITMIIGAFGIISNVTISFIQSKRSIAVMSSLGLSKNNRGYMIILEGIFQALIGCAISLIAAFGINLCLTDIFKFLTMDLEINYPFKSIGAIIICTIILMFVTSISSIFKSRKLQIVKELKYE